MKKLLHIITLLACLAAGQLHAGPSNLANPAETLATIREFHEHHGYLLDPHSTVGVAVALRQLDPAVRTICLATAHPAKFPDAIAQAIGSADLATAPAIEALKGLPTRKTTLPNDPAAVAAFIQRHIEEPTTTRREAGSAACPAKRTATR